MKTVFINTSDIAVFVNQSKWDIVTPFERLWKKCDSEYDSIIKSARDSCGENTEQLENVKRIVLDKKKQVEEYINPEILKKHLESKTESVTVKRKNINSLINSLDISPDTKIKLQEHTSNLVNTTHGVINEQQVVDIYEKKFNVTLDTSQKFYKKQLCTSGTNGTQYTWMICGKVDGIYDDATNEKESYIVEIKNRVRGFFKSVRDYENTQVQIYMWILENYEYTMLEEHYNGKIKSTKVYKDNDYINDILSRLSGFIHNFEQQFLNVPSVKNDYIFMTSHDKQEFIESLMVL